jgi:hypothetical protein
MIWLLLVIPAGIALLSVRYLRAVTFLRDQQKVTGAQVISPEEKVISEAGLTVQVYRHAKATTTLVIVPGLHPDGIHDPRAQTFAASCARAGFQVVAADVAEFRNFRITNDGIQSIASLVESLAGHFPESSLQKVGLLGISYGFGPALLAAARQEVSERIDFLISIGGYYQLYHALEFALTGIHDHDGFRQRSSPQPWARMIFAMTHLEELLPGSSDIDCLKELFLLRLNSKDEAARNAEERLSPSGKTFLEKVLQGMTPDTLGGFGPLLSRLKPELVNMSPATVLSRLRPDLRLYLLHGRSDDLVPCVETLELEHALKAQGHPFVRALITDQLGHVDVAGVSNLFDFLRLIRWSRRVLSEVRPEIKARNHGTH